MKIEETYNSYKETLLSINDSLSSLLSTVQSKPEIADTRFNEWQNACSDIHQQITEDVVRIAVIGPIKSGKSTFVNSLFKGDYLKRGAGVVTSIVTRIRSGEQLKASLFFKSWDEVNADIEQALVMLPSWKRSPDEKPFDIRREKDRHSLRSALRGLSNDLLIKNGIRNSNIVLLSLYFKGYDHISEKISADFTTTEFSGNHFAEHRIYVADDMLAVYLKDIELEIDNDSIDRSLEFADCQGSDSPNPLHLAMIQDYLMRTHLIIYVISSRTGLRQADIKFLSMIKNMGIIENIIFIVNCDFSEHESLEDLNHVVDKVKEELTLIRPQPHVYTFSTLFNLFNELSGNLMKKDSIRLAQWKEEEDMVAFSNNETQRFESSLNKKLTQERFDLLLKNHLERISVILSGIERWVEINKELLTQDVDSALILLKKMEHRHARMDQIKSLIKNTFNGAKEDITKKLKNETDRFFNNYTEGVLKQTSTFVNTYKISVEDYREKLMNSGFSNTLYLVFQEFKQALDVFMTENINPKIARFSAETDKKIKTSLESIANPYWTLALDEIAELKASLNKPSKENDTPHKEQNLLDMDVLKRVAGLKLPSSTAVLRYSTKMKTEALVRLGFYSVKKLVKKVFKQPSVNKQEEQMRALADGIRIIKNETEKSIVFHFENYRENFKFQYVSKLIEASSEHLHQLLMEQFQSYNTDIKALEKVIQQKGNEREETINFLDRIALDALRIQDIVDSTRDKVQT